MSTGRTVFLAMHELTARPLVFGDEIQIAARRFIESVDRCEAVLRKCQCPRQCDECAGTGQAACYHCHNEYDCEDCGGTGISKCLCIEPFAIDVLRAAQARLK